MLSKKEMETNLGKSRTEEGLQWAAPRKSTVLSMTFVILTSLGTKPKIEWLRQDPVILSRYDDTKQRQIQKRVQWARLGNQTYMYRYVVSHYLSNWKPHSFIVDCMYFYKIICAKSMPIQPSSYVGLIHALLRVLVGLLAPNLR